MAYEGSWGGADRAFSTEEYTVSGMMQPILCDPRQKSEFARGRPAGIPLRLDQKRTEGPENSIHQHNMVRCRRGKNLSGQNCSQYAQSEILTHMGESIE